MIAEIGSPPWEDRLASILLESGTSIEDGRELAAVEARLEGDREHAAGIEDRMLRTSTTMGLGMLALRRGHIDDAIAALEVAVDAPDGADPVNNVLSALIALATAHAQGGDAAAAERVLARVDAQRQAQPRLARRLAPELEVARALTEAAAGRVSAAIQRLLACAGAGHEHPLAEAECLYATLRLGADPRPVAEPLAARAARVQSAAVALYADHARAAAGADADGLLDVRERSRSSGWTSTRPRPPALPRSPTTTTGARRRRATPTRWRRATPPPARARRSAR